MKNQKMLSFACALALTAGLTGCENPPAAVSSGPAAETAIEAETTVPEETVSPDTLLAMELVNHYLNMEKPQHESIQTRFGLVTAKKQRPIAWYEDYSYTSTGEAALVTSLENAFTLDSDLYDDMTFDGYYACPEEALWLGDIADENWLSLQTYYVKSSNGEDARYNPFWASEYQDLSQEPQIFDGFSSLPRKPYHAFLRDAAGDPALAAQLFTLSEDRPYDMERKQKVIKEALSHAGQDENGTAFRENPEALQPCYTVSFHIPGEYLAVYSTPLINQIFEPWQNVFGSAADAAAVTGKIHSFEAAHPVKARLSKGNAHISLYFDRETGECIGEKLDLTDCSRDLMEKLCALEHIEPGDRSFVIEKQYFDNDFEALPDFIQHQEPAGQKENQAVFWTFFGDYRTSQHHQIYSTDQYGMYLNIKTGLYEITDGKDVIGTLQRYDFFDRDGVPDDYLYTDTMALHSEALTSKTGLSYDLHQVSMGALFGPEDPDPKETGYMALFGEEKDHQKRGILVSAWDRETAMAIMDDLTLTTAEMPKFFQ